MCEYGLKPTKQNKKPAANENENIREKQVILREPSKTNSLSLYEENGFFIALFNETFGFIVSLHVRAICLSLGFDFATQNCLLDCDITYLYCPHDLSKIFQTEFYVRRVFRKICC